MMLDALVVNRVVAKKIVSQLRFSLSWSPFFARDLDLEQFLSPIFRYTLNAGLPNFVFTRWRTQDTEREHAKQVLETRFYFNYFTCYGGTDTQGSQDFIPNFSFRQLDMVQILNDCMSVT